jgi:hypothetical protein
MNIFAISSKQMLASISVHCYLKRGKTECATCMINPSPCMQNKCLNVEVKLVQFLLKTVNDFLNEHIVLLGNVIVFDPLVGNLLPDYNR